MKNFTLLLITILSAALCSCGGIDVEQTLTQAESCIQAGDLASAASSCDLLCDTTATRLSPTQMCRVAILYAKISELSDKQDYMASATQCFERAVSLSAQTDSLDMYIETLDVEDQSLLRIIKDVSHAMTAPINLTEDMGDSDMAEEMACQEADSDYAYNQNTESTL